MSTSQEAAVGAEEPDISAERNIERNAKRNIKRNAKRNAKERQEERQEEHLFNNVKIDIIILCKVLYIGSNSQIFSTQLSKRL